MTAAKNLIPFQEFVSNNSALQRTADDEEDDGPDLSDLSEEQVDDFKILRYVSKLYDQCRKAREPFETFDIAWDLFVGNVFPKSWPTWRAKITINKIRAIITFMQAIMTDNKPRMSVEPLVQGTEDAADTLRHLVDRDWDENDMQGKLSTFVLYGLVWGTSFMKVTYDPYANSGRGKHMATPVVPYRIYANITASCIEDAEVIIHEDEQTMGWVRRNFPDRARAVYSVIGARAKDRTQSNRDYIREGDGANESQRIISAQSVNGNVSGPSWSYPNQEYKDDDHEIVNIKEYWFRDDTLEEFQQPVYENGKPKMEPVLDDEGMHTFDVVGQKIITSEIDGRTTSVPDRKPKMKAVMQSAWRLKYPNGRLVIVAGDKVRLRDIPNPFQTDGFPFAMWKDYDTGAFWGTGEPLALKDTQIALVRVISQIYDILEKTGNPSFKMKKGAGVNAQTIRNRPGSIIPMDEMDALQPLDKPAIPAQFMEVFTALSGAMGTISGVTDTVMGANPASNTAFATMDQLQESGAAPIRLKVRNLESGMTRIGKLRVQLIQQWDNGARPLRSRDEGSTPHDPDVPQPAASVNVQWKTYTNADLQGAVEFGVVPISSLSTSPAGAWNRWMTMYDKHLVDRRWWHEKFRVEGWRTQLPRMEKTEQAEAKAAADAKAQGGKPGPAGKSLSTGPRRRKAPGAAPSHVPSREANARVR